MHKQESEHSTSLVHKRTIRKTLLAYTIVLSPGCCDLYALLVSDNVYYDVTVCPEEVNTDQFRCSRDYGSSAGATPCARSTSRRFMSHVPK